MAAITYYTPPANRIVHSTGVDFGSRPSSFQPVHLVQYDQGLPIVAVSLYKDGQVYNIPIGASGNVLVGKRDQTFVSNPVLGCNMERTIVYFEATYQMLYYFGTIKPILEIKMSDIEYAGSSSITMIIDPNPIQDWYIESSNEYKSVEQLIKEANIIKNEIVYLIETLSKSIISEDVLEDWTGDEILDSSGNIIFTTVIGRLTDVANVINALLSQNQKFDSKIEALSERIAFLEEQGKQLQGQLATVLPWEARIAYLEERARQLQVQFASVSSWGIRITELETLASRVANLENRTIMYSDEELLDSNNNRILDSSNDPIIASTVDKINRRVELLEERT